MSTESTSDISRGLDVRPPREILAALVAGQRNAIQAVERALPAIEAAAEASLPRLKRGGRLIYAGAGTSGRIGVQDGVELTPTFDWLWDHLGFMLAGGEPALLRSVEGAEDDRYAAAQEVTRLAILPDDIVLALAASGTTPFTVAAVEHSRKAGALTIGFANNPDTPLLTTADYPVLLETGAEVIAGSTRMQAGTAQKAALNLYSSLVMIRLGRVYDGHMVDLRATNAKLVHRAERMLVTITGATEADAREALKRCKGRVKPAVLVLKGLSPKAADTALARAEGNLRKALEALG
ncbi:MAG: N-acetylmuramic acid 6-phosphate etherase [Proteobacteria bacterium]|nr:N-acetylmuramic acid 6-phosphate etherase [Pseudomonadota bacterium]MBI3498113.1 N-acetylmuramic acid 6-phosphate etherase [Pseudomonadota bacterium]